MTGRPATGSLRRMCLDPSGLDQSGDVVGLTAALVDVESVSGHEAHLADLVEARAGAGAAVLKRLSATANVVLRPHRVRAGPGGSCSPGISTPCPWSRTTSPSRIVDGDRLYGCGSTSDMKSGVAVANCALAYVVGIRANLHRRYTT